MPGPAVGSRFFREKNSLRSDTFSLQKRPPPPTSVLCRRDNAREGKIKVRDKDKDRDRDRDRDRDKEQDKKKLLEQVDKARVRDNQGIVTAESDEAGLKNVDQRNPQFFGSVFRGPQVVGNGGVGVVFRREKRCLSEASSFFPEENHPHPSAGTLPKKPSPKHAV